MASGTSGLRSDGLFQRLGEWRGLAEARLISVARLPCQSVRHSGGGFRGPHMWGVRGSGDVLSILYLEAESPVYSILWLKQQAVGYLIH